ncbi:phosphotransferase family protein [Actinomadura bangladeshensis]|uniref:Aminoglycoside phosphotransferase family protein n=1 Tax=Actinomadura bangladeshensis TaxID=453573 RepID=A0A4R4P7A5_9ACTN|nr:phosphotransferase [Actinomadura bangladeshensis]TDC17869.1 aminoglycoside phosphotransferase family protein [Actinomadura bangladeshensis]
MDASSSTHAIEMRPDVVIKRYRSRRNDEPRREWLALNLLHEHARGIAPAPIGADLDAEPPTVVMSRLSGTPLNCGPVAESAVAVASAVARVQEAVPLRTLAHLPARAGHPLELLRQVRTWCAAVQRPADDPTVTDALRGAEVWLRQPALEAMLGRPTRPVFGIGDGNLANFLWDGTEVRLVDFEYSGRSDRPYELAELTEHISVQTANGPGMDNVLKCFDLDPTEADRIKNCRRLLAAFWLLRIMGDDRGEPRIRAKVLAGQATRLLTLLDQPHP